MDNAFQTVRVSDPGVVDGAWHNVGFTFDETTGEFQAFLDGATVATETLDGVSLADTSSRDVWLGGAAWGDSLDGDVDNLAVYNEVAKETDEGLVLAMQDGSEIMLMGVTESDADWFIA
jgi:hypothetical protein